MAADQIDDIQLADPGLAAPDLIVEKTEEAEELVLHVGLPFPLVDGAGQVHQDQLAFGLETGLAVVAGVEDDQEQIDGAAGGVDLVGHLDVGGVVGQDLGPQVVDHPVGDPGVGVDPGDHLPLVAG